MATRFVRLATLTLGTAAAAVCAFAQGNCEKLTSLKLDHASVVSAENIPAGDFKLPPGLLPSINLPAFCRVKVESKPSNDSLIKIEVWMPVDGWNQKFEQAGNGGLAGSINLLGLGEELKNGFAVAATDDGHQGQGTDGSWAIGHPEKVKDFGYRAVHETSVDAKTVIAAFYQASPKYAYFNGCSEGGREALMEAQRYPDDFDGILAGSPAHYWTKVMMALAWNSQALGSPGAFPSEAKREAVQKAVIAACGTQNRVRDDFVKDPLKCNFDPEVLLCKSGDADSCLTQAQVDALRKVYTGPRNSAGRKLSSGYEPGAEAEPGLPGLSLSSYVFGAGPGMNLDTMFSTAFYANFVFDDPNWKVSQFNFDTDVSTADAKIGSVLNADDPDLKGFLDRHGKLIQYHGWNDGVLPPRHSVEYFAAVADKMEGVDKTQQFYRLFMAPGVMHCGQGAGPDEFGNAFDLVPSTDATHNVFLALQEWVEKNIAPDKIIATRYKKDNDPTSGLGMTRPLCPYPKEAMWEGKGDTSDAATWSCSTPTETKARK